MFKLIKLEEVDSTNEWVKRNKDKLPDLDGVIAKVQTQGKGRGKNKWFSPPGGLWLSIIVREFSNNKGALSLLSSVAIAEALENYGLNVELKWPNDIMVSSKKMGGILIEKINKFFIIGIGLNLNVEPSDFLDSLQGKMTSSRKVLKRSLPIEEIGLEIMKNIEKGREEFDRIYARYLGLNQDLGRKVKLVSSKKTVTGRVILIENDCGIRINCGDVESTFYSGSLVYI